MENKSTVVITDWVLPEYEFEQQFFAANGAELVLRPCKTERELIDLVTPADGVITQFALLSAPVIQAMKRAKVIVRLGIGVDNVDVEKAREHRIPVCNIPDYCTDEVADHTVAFILAATRQVIPNTLHLREGKWGLAVPLKRMLTLRHLTVGLVGFGRIGHEVANRLKPFGCRIIIFDPRAAVEKIKMEGFEPVASFESIMIEADIISLHCPSTEETRNMVNTQTLAKMKPGAIFINVGRGDLVETAALISALENGQVGSAALDVFSPEPIQPGSPLLKMPNVILSAHVAAFSPTALQRARETAVRTVLLALQGKPLPNVVNGVDSK